jgi:hypothetical protein
MKKSAVALFFMAGFGGQTAFGNTKQSESSSEFVYDCQADREFLTTYEYLKTKASVPWAWAV